MSVATMGQATEITGKLRDVSRDRVQRLIDGWDLVVKLMDVDPDSIDRLAFDALLNPSAQLPAGLLTPVDQLVARFMARNELRNWGFTDNDAESLRQQLQGHDHAGPLLPLSLSIWLGSLERTWAEALLWALDTAREVGLTADNYLANVKPEFYKGSEFRGRKRQLDVVGLDFQTFYDPVNGIAPDRIRPQRERWPSLEVLYFLALNPGYLKAMDGNKLPWLMAPGLVVHGVNVPFFYRYGRGFFANSSWSYASLALTAVVAFRELQH